MKCRMRWMRLPLQPNACLRSRRAKRRRRSPKRRPLRIADSPGAPPAMAHDPEAEHVDENEGGPVKSFLEHLEDLRWVLVKSGSTVGVAMLVCLLAGNYLVRILEWPLQRAHPLHLGKGQTVLITFGTNQLTRFRIGTNDPFSSVVGTNRFTHLEIVPITVGTNQVLGMARRPGPEIEPGLGI